MAEDWIEAVDLDGTLAHSTASYDPAKIGEPIDLMVERVKQWLRQGREVRIFTARVAHDNSAARIKETIVAYGAIQKWCVKHLGQALPVTCVKAPNFRIWDNQAVAVESDTGKLI
jgi:hypothetical protein